MSQLAGDEIYQILSFCCNDSKAIIYEYSLINWQWREECMKFPLCVKDQPISKALDRFRIVKLKLGYSSYQDRLPHLELKHLTKLTTPNLLELSNECSIMKCQFWKNLKTLKITDFSLSYQHVILLCACNDFTNLEHLEFHFTQKHSNKSTFEIFNNSHFTNVKTAILQSGMTRVKIKRKLEKLERLTLRGCITTVDIGKNLLPNLKELDISQNFDLADLSFLKSIPQLTYLNLDCNTKVEFKDNLSTLQNLKHLSMSVCCFGNQNLILGEIQLRNVEFLKISHNALKLTKFFNDGKSCVSNITHLDVSNHAYYFQDDDCQLIGSGIVLRNLTFLSLSNSFGIHNFEAIINGPNMENLKTLELHSSRISIENIKSITTSPTLTQLTNLDVSNNSIKDEGCKILCQAPNLKLLQELEISENNLSEKCGKSVIMKCFPNLKQLKMQTESISIYD